jgi:hypothetical protein
MTGTRHFSDNDLSKICETPEFVPYSGSFTDSVEVYIGSQTEGTDIYFTLDGTYPTTNSFLFNGPIVLESTTTIKARAFRMNWCPSDVGIATYTLTVANDDNIIPAPVFNCSAFPNPFINITDINFSLPKSSKVNLSIYNSKGQLVRTLTDSQFSKGEHTLAWDGKTDTNQQCANGIYLYRLQGNGFSLTEKLMLTK